MLIFLGTTETEKNVTLDELKSNATDVTIDDLYGENVKNGTYVKLKAYVTGIADNKTGATVGQIIDYGSWVYSIDYSNMIVVNGIIPEYLYDGDEVWIYGIFKGPITYEPTVRGTRTAPGIENGFFEKTGHRTHVVV